MIGAKGFLVCTAVLIFAVSTTIAQISQPRHQDTVPPLQNPQQNIIITLDTPKQETPSSVPAGNTQLSAPSKYNTIIKPGTITRTGVFTVHKVEDTYYFEIPDSLLGRDL